MLRPPSTLTRALRALVALVTVWCLGCSAFEPLLDHLAGVSAGVGMVCASDGGASERLDVSPSSAESSGGAAAAALSSPSVTSIAAPTDAPAGQHAYECGCLSCHAVQLALAGVAPARPAHLERLQALEPGTPSSVSREPLVPPPQRAL